MSGSHLCHNPRVIKSASSLARYGFSVEVLGAWSDPILKARDEDLLTSMPFGFTPVLDVTTNKVSKFCGRMRIKAGHFAQQFFNKENRWQLGYFYPELRRAAFRRNADLFIAHSEQAMAVGVDLLRIGRRVGVDLEDWFSEDLLPEARRHRPVRLLRSLEKELLLDGFYSSCPSRAMSVALAEENQCVPPTVIFNAFKWSERRLLDGAQRDRRSRQLRSIHWFSQTLGRGRGLEDLLSALPLLKNTAEIHLRGQPTDGFEEWLKAHVPDGWRDRIYLHGLVTNPELLSRIAEHDIGLAGEIPYCRSRDLTVTNKILYYLLAGLAVIASDTTGQREIAEQAPNAVLLYPSGNSGTLAARLDSLLGSSESMEIAKISALQAAEQTFCWERQEKVLLQGVAQALAD
jgi:glycosyltransferase involved in cell wall biosynthesis